MITITYTNVYIVQRKACSFWKINFTKMILDFMVMILYFWLTNDHLNDFATINISLEFKISN